MMATQRQQTANILFVIVVILAMMPFFSPSLGLALGIGMAVVGVRTPMTARFAPWILQTSVVLLGFGMNLPNVVETGLNGIGITAISVIGTLFFGHWLAKKLKVNSKTGWLIAAGTAICGGSAIAAVAPAINARDTEVSFSLIVVFVLNAIALLLFPFIGHFLHLGQETFGIWSAIAIHDTSSVVGAGATYGPQALEIATTVKLTRALWIIPVSLAITLVQKQNNKGSIKIPWFIFLFIVATVMAYFMPQWESVFTRMNWLGHKGMAVALFAIGANMAITDIKQAGFRSFLMGITLWLTVATATLVYLYFSN